MKLRAGSAIATDDFSAEVLIASVAHAAAVACVGNATPHVAMDTSHFWVAGVIIHLLGASLSSVGFLMQKRSHQGLRKDETYWRTSPWLMGSLVWALGNVVS